MKHVIVIKIGGAAAQSLTADFLGQLNIWKEAGKALLIVHGGGFAIDRLMEENHRSVKKVNGLRVTDKADMLLVKKALTEQVGPPLAQHLNRAGLPAVTVNADLPNIVKADFLQQELYGYVGQVKEVVEEPLRNLLTKGLVPLLPSLGYSKEGELLNINADYLARAVAQAMSAEKLILMTDVPGILENGSVLASLPVSSVQEKIADATITGGMIPKVESAAQTVLAGVGEVLIGNSLNQGTVIKKG
ncbi:acetylglutamate kinase [Streptococcus chenjunshii]|uniref:Acetylglutamate kinase n=1 Tax=Streptococcus chenjunshii TaxID=2173853 RepID=A0A372KKQ1_9STRE|nr:acetylglutamate kinase [Streptococcus chenjunshii]AXQ78297.1 acetylglutamate kinase [Streptococcus chenjunshii]RFU50744.1 acetylglutamate kinase [Streptococcus chenjunshii]RFU52855.1 acetylglutamate kinase [Streptococcus chenjunshii]